MNPRIQWAKTDANLNSNVKDKEPVLLMAGAKEKVDVLVLNSAKLTN